MMGPEHRLAAVLVLSTALSLPALSAMLADEVEPAAVGIRYGVAVAIVWAAIRLLERMIDGYGADIQQTAAADPNDSADPTPERRRARDEARAAGSPVDVPSTGVAQDESG